ncbi:MAG: invasion associated locus B family protein [Alphaproteobacteria bacterium]
MPVTCNKSASDIGRPQSAARAGKVLAIAMLAIGLGCAAQAQDSTQAPSAQGQAAPAQAAQLPTGTDPGWVKQCSTNPQTSEEVCVITRERRANTGQLLAAVSIREVGDKKVLVTAVPPGMLLRPGLQVQIDGSEPAKVAYSICFPNLCFAETEINAEFVASLKRGNNLVVTTLNQQAKPVNFDVSLSGFTKSYDGAAIDPQKLQENSQRLEDELKRKAEDARRKLIEKQQSQ